MDLEAIEARAKIAAAMLVEWEDTEEAAECCAADVPDLIARVRELEAEIRELQAAYDRLNAEFRRVSE